MQWSWILLLWSGALAWRHKAPRWRMATLEGSGGFAVRAVGVGKSHSGDKGFVLRNVDLVVPPGSRFALVGANGSGKSTLLRCLADMDSLDEGEVEVAKGTRVVYVEQEPPPEDAGTVLEAIFSGRSPGTQAVRKYYGVVDRAAEDVDAFSEAVVAMEEHEGWKVEAHAKAAAERLRLSHLWTRETLQGLSGGERKRIALAAAIAEVRPGDVLLLDEPTNHLDARAVEWLAELISPPEDAVEDLLRGVAVITVTHDRFFLKNSCRTGMLEISMGELFLHQSKTWEEFLEKRAQREAIREQQAEQAENMLKKEQEWARKQPKARESKSKSRMEAFEELKQDVMLKKQEQRELLGIGIDLSATGASQRLGGFVAEVDAITLTKPTEEPTLEDVLLDDLSFTLSPGDTLGIVGPNGAGKTTLLRALAGTSASGTVLDGKVLLGSTVRVGYYEQQKEFGPDEEKMKVLPYILESVTKTVTAANSAISASGGAPIVVTAPEDYFEALAAMDNEAADGYDRDRAEASSETGTVLKAVTEAEAISLMRRFGFSAKRSSDRLKDLSGGERKRLQLLTMLASRPNFLLLDEPTNDLDLWTLAALEKWLLEEFKGAAVIVSHDRAFMDNVVKKLLILQPRMDSMMAPTHRFFQDTFSAYLDELSAEEREAAALASAELAEKREAAAALPQKNQRTVDPKKDGKLKKEYEKLMPALEKLEERLSGLQEELEKKGAEGAGYSVLQDLTDEISEVETDIAVKEERWLELEEIFGT